MTTLFFQQGTHGDITCSVGSHGRLCSVCDPGYFKHKSSGNCLKCGDWAGEEAPLELADIREVAAVLDELFKGKQKIDFPINSCHELCEES